MTPKLTTYKYDEVIACNDKALRAKVDAFEALLETLASASTPDVGHRSRAVPEVAVVPVLDTDHDPTHPFPASLPAYNQPYGWLQAHST